MLKYNTIPQETICHWLGHDWLHGVKRVGISLITVLLAAGYSSGLVADSTSTLVADSTSTLVADSTSTLVADSTSNPVAGSTVAGSSGSTAPDTEEVTAVTIMTFNVENLFDNKNDPGKNDETFLALKDKRSASHKRSCNRIRVDYWRYQCLAWDWNDAVLDRKLVGIARSIRQVGDGQGPDIIALQEVENIHILEHLRNSYLQGLGYLPGVLIEGRDKRGIDVAFLSKLPVTDIELHEIPFSGLNRSSLEDTRGILEATFELPKGETLVGYAVHFPAPFHPTEMREMAYAKLAQLKADLPAGQATFAAGDFNTTSEEDREKKMLVRLVKPDWLVVHEFCKGCKGSSYYPPKDDWSFLDMILWSQGDSQWRMDKDSVFLANKTAAQVTKQATPARFHLPGASGVSDHWPMVFTIFLSDQALPHQVSD